MADLPPYPEAKGDSGDDARGGPDRGSTPTSASYPGTPRWVKASGMVVIVLVLLVVVVMLAGIGGSHGPGRHLPSGGAGGQTPPLAHRVQQP